MVFKNKNTSHRSGFTIVELTIVIVVIGILAAIAVVGYGAWRQRVSEDAVKSDLTNVSSSMENAKNFSEGYPVYTIGTVFDGSNSSKSLFVQSDDVVLTYREGDAKSYCIEGYSNTRPGVTFFTDTEIDNGKPARGTCSAGKQIPGEIAWQESNQSAVYEWAQVFIANDGQHIMARASNYSHTFASSDGGQSWSQATIGGSGSAKAFDFTPQGSLGIATNMSNSYGTTYLTSDYGMTWPYTTSSPRITWYDVVISAQGNNMIGFLSPATNGTIEKAARYSQDPSHPYYYRISSQGSVSPRSPSVRWIAIDASDDLTAIVGATIDGPIYTLSGGTWV